MSLFNSFKKALGFPEEYEDLDDIADLEDNDETEEQENQLSGEHVETPVREIDPVSLIKGFTAEIVKHADRCKSTTDDDESYRKNLSAAVGSELEALAYELKKNAEEKWEKQKDALGRKLDSLTKEKESLSSQRDGFERSRLSDDRQKRTMKERISDLERQVSVLEAEREQLLLENQSMVNKLRGQAMPVVNAAGRTDSQDLESENSRLRRELNGLKRQLAAVQKKETSAKENQAETLKEEIDRLKAEVAEHKGRAARLANTLSIAETSNEELQQRLDTAQRRTEELEKTITDLQLTIQANLRDHAMAQSVMKDEIEALKSTVNEKPSDRVKTPRKRGRKKKQPEDEQLNAQQVKISAIDELMDNTDWFAAPEPGPRIKDPEVVENFGYKEQPKKANRKTNDNQLTLF